jgi:hypothetical protein
VGISKEERPEEEDPLRTVFAGHIAVRAAHELAHASYSHIEDAQGFQHVDPLTLHAR